MTLSAQVSKLGDSLPSRATAGCVFPLCQKLLSFLGSLGLLSVNFSVVGLVEGVDVFLGSGDCLLLLSGRGLVSAGEIGIPLFSPGSDGLGVVFLLLRGVAGGVRCGRGIMGSC